MGNLTLVNYRNPLELKIELKHAMHPITYFPYIHSNKINTNNNNTNVLILQYESLGRCLVSKRETSVSCANLGI